MRSPSTRRPHIDNILKVPISIGLRVEIASLDLGTEHEVWMGGVDEGAYVPVCLGVVLVLEELAGFAEATLFVGAAVHGDAIAVFVDVESFEQSNNVGC